ncbi:capsular polysaccharide transport system permease protein [Phyllobacterium trifolii]|uniref:Capsular polysaccharide transport system permease protein n=1 Tax=Phyllobacterium trifolii TaxID=300193 RepID=A0A839UJ20_9HYPH|nr:hypothetical protein [Phyllobacterium trifolii]MBB3149753.1 capsular polysaccharide transport system permease protein [Phyllobacterium trifolii]
MNTHKMPTESPPILSRTERKQPPLTRISWSTLSFLVVVIIPILLIVSYYTFIASDQYRSQTLFAVRGTTTSPLSLLGLTSLPGANVQSGDAHIVSDYIQSKQVLIDVLEKKQIDARKYYSNLNIDAVYRIKRDLSFDEFLEYWNRMTDVEFNSNTGITTFNVNAFSARDAQLMSESVLSVSEELVNRLSDNARQQLISTAKEEVERTENRLKNARQAVESFRNREQALDPQLLAQSEQTIIGELQTKLVELKARQNALLATTQNSPTLRVINREIEAIEEQIENQKKRVGSGGSHDSDTSSERSLSRIYTDYSTLLLEQEFAEKAYTSALTSLEQSLSEARKQERYFAIIAAPSLPEVALYPKRTSNVLMSIAGLCVCWLLGYLIVQSVRDHAIRI